MHILNLLRIQNGHYKPNLLFILFQLSGSKATGLDKISSKIIRIAVPIISDSLIYIFNRTIIQCTFSNEC